MILAFFHDFDFACFLLNFVKTSKKAMLTGMAFLK